MWNAWRKNMKADHGSQSQQPPSDAQAHEHNEMKPEQVDGDHFDVNQPDSMKSDASPQIAELTAQLDEAKARLLRQMADFQNYQRRALQNEQVAKSEGAAKVASSVVTVLDHFDFALSQDTNKATAEQILHGVKVIREELLKILAGQGVGIIRPSPNDEFSPGRHEAVMQQAGEGIQPGKINAVFQQGYIITTPTGERVLRAAKVSVAPN